MGLHHGVTTPSAEDLSSGPGSGDRVDPASLRESRVDHWPLNFGLDITNPLRDTCQSDFLLTV